jgi:hypothetical protein
MRRRGRFDVGRPIARPSGVPSWVSQQRPEGVALNAPLLNALLLYALDT